MWSNIKMLRLVLLCCTMLCLGMFSGCRMCAPYTDITGSPVANGISGDGYRAGSQYGGYSGGAYYMGGYQSTASPQRVDSEFSRPTTGSQTSGTKTIQTHPQNPSSYYVPSGNQVVPANYYAASPTAAR